MLRYSIFFIFLLSCSQSFIEETRDMVSIEATVSNNTLDTGILLEWKSQWDFVNIEVLKGNNAANLAKYKENVVQTSLLDENTIAGQDYYYQINAYNSKGRQIGASSILKGERSYRALAQTELPKNLQATQRVYSDQIHLLWTGNPLDRFRIYRSDTKTRSYSLLAEVGFSSLDELKYIDSKVQPATEYSYKISVVGKDTDSSIKEKYATDIIKGSTLDAPSEVVASKDLPGAITISWKKDSSVDYYKVYRSSTVDGEFKLITPFVGEFNYIDNNLPNYTGKLINGKFTYPSYFYKIQSVKKGLSSGMSAAAEGSAIDPADFLEAPELSLTLNKSSYPYQLTLSWTPLSVEGVTYNLVKVNEANQTNAILENTTVNSTTVPVEAFNSRWTYVLRPINNAVNGLLGGASEQIYRNTTPAPPAFATITTNASYDVVETPNKTPRDVYVYYYYKPWFQPGKTFEVNVGQIEEEWLITPHVGYIDLTWEKAIGDSIDVYKVYRRKQGASEWNLLTNINGMKDTKFTLRDKNFRPSDYKGTGSGDNFKYPMYEYKLTASFNNQESADSLVVSGSAIDPEDILPAPSHVNIPGHWASGIGFGSSKWRVGAKSAPDADLIHNKGGVNHLYLVWGDVSGATDYRVRHAIGDTKNKGWYENRSRYPHAKGNTTRFQWFNNETTSVEYTALYESSDFTSYMRNMASFDVAAVNGAKGGVIGQSRAIFFKEAAENPF